MGENKSARERERRKLQRLTEALTNVNAVDPVVSVLDLFADILVHDLGISKVVVLIRVRDSFAIYRTHGTNVSQEICYQDFSGFTDLTHLPQDTSGELCAFDAVLPVIIDNQARSVFLLGHEDNSLNRVSTIIREDAYLRTWLQILTAAYQKDRRIRERVKQYRLQQEVALTQQIQRSLLPKDINRFKHFRANAVYRTLSEVGGDYYNIIPIDDYRYFICVADASGKGISAGIFMTFVQASLNAVIDEAADVRELAQRMNRLIIQRSQSEQFVTAIFALYDSRDGSLDYVNCGHPAAALRTKGVKQLTLLKSNTQGLGMIDNLVIQPVPEVTCTAGSTLVMFTDGVIELSDNEDNYVEFEGLKKTLQTDYASPGQLNQTILQNIGALNKGNKTVQDDIVLLTLMF